MNKDTLRTLALMIAEGAYDLENSAHRTKHDITALYYELSGICQTIKTITGAYPYCAVRGNFVDVCICNYKQTFNMKSL